MNLDLQTIKALVEKYMDIPDIGIRTRQMDICYARYVYYLLSRDYIKDPRRKNCKIPLKSIADNLGMNHASAINGIRRLKDLLDNPRTSLFDNRIRDAYYLIKDLIEEKGTSNYKFSLSEKHYMNKYLDVVKENQELKKKLEIRFSSATVESLFAQFPKEHPDGIIRLKALINGLKMTHGRDKITVIEANGTSI